jgi:hypothetical protein
MAIFYPTHCRRRRPGQYGGWFATLVIVVLVQIFPARLAAQFAYVTNNGGVTITAYTGSGPAVAIPDTITGLPVTGIGSNVFSMKMTLTAVSIPSTVVTIGDRAFGSCRSLAGLNLPANLTFIGDGAFNFCESITNLILPNGVTNVGTSAFASCHSLASISIPESLTSLGDAVFNNCFALPTVTIPNTVSNLGVGAFYCCTSLTNVVLGTGLTNIGARAFAYCNKLASVNIPAVVTSIGTNAFVGGVAAINVDPANPVYSSLDGVLFDRNQTVLIEYPGGSKVPSYTVPDTVTNIATVAFDSRTWLKSVTLGDNVVGIDDYAFQSSGLTNVSFGNNLRSIGNYAFASSPLAEVAFPASLTNIGACAFYECGMAGAYFKGDAPAVGYLAVCAPVYYLPGTTGWGPYLGNGPTELWLPELRAADARFGTPNHQFGFNIAWAAGRQVVIESSTNLDPGIWLPLQTKVFATDLEYFSDPDWTNSTARVYRVRAP